MLRRALTTLVLGLALAAGSTSAAAEQPAVSLSVTPSTPSPTGSARTPSGRRDYDVSFRVSLSATEECENLSVAYSYGAVFDGRPSLAGGAMEFYDTNAPATAATFDVHAEGNAADTVVLHVRGSCEQSDGTVLSRSAPVIAKVTVPAHPCEQGPLAVLGVRGKVARQDLVSAATRVRVRPGQYLWAGYRVWLARRSSATFGAAQCHGLRIAVKGARSFVPGDYAAGSDGSPTQLGSGGIADFRGDQHSGGVATGNAIAVPRGGRHAPSRVARFRVASLGRTTRVDVTSGTVYVAGRTGPERYTRAVVARAGQRVVVSCAASRRCVPSTPA